MRCNYWIEKIHWGWWNSKNVKRKAQLYTVFSVIFYLQREDENVTDVHVEKLKNFVKLYSVFDNDMDMDGKLSDEEKNIYDMLKKYKLASSEGLNKHTNRMIRYNVLKDFLCDKKNTDDIQAGLYDKIVNYVEERWFIIWLYKKILTNYYFDIIFILK